MYLMYRYEGPRLSSIPTLAPFEVPREAPQHIHCGRAADSGKSEATVGEGPSDSDCDLNRSGRFGIEGFGGDKVSQRVQVSMQIVFGFRGH